jgi:hypothetical protein
MLNGPNDVEFGVRLTRYWVHSVTVNCCSISETHPGALLVTRIENVGIRCFY